MIDFSSALDSTTLQLRKQVPRELVVAMFQKMVRGQSSIIIILLTLFTDPEPTGDSVYGRWSPRRNGYEEGYNQASDEPL